MEHKFNFNKPDDLDKDKCLSISSVIDMISPAFDREKVAEKTHNKHFNNPESQYYQMSVEEIMEAWEEKGATSRYYGSSLDDYIGFRLNGTSNEVEIFKLDKVDGDERMEGLCESFESFYNKYIENGPLEYVDREQYVYYPIDIDGEKWYIRGRFDCLFYNKEKEHYVIVDWKSNGEIEINPTKWTERLNGPAKTLYNLSGVKYTAQVFFYKSGLEYQCPEETVDVAITNLPGYDAEKNPQVNVYGAQFKYDKDFMDKIFTYAIKKKKLLGV